MSEEKRFQDWNDVDCNECQHYWDSSCDGASKGSTVACNSYLATRSIVIPAKIQVLEQRVKTLTRAVMFIVGLDVCGLIVGLIGELLFG